MTLSESSRYSLEELLKLLKIALTPLLQKNSIQFAILAGSWVRNQQQWWSDIDIFISWPEYTRLSSKKRLEYLIKINTEAERLTNLNKLEIRILQKKSLHTQFNILKEGIVFYELILNSRNDYLEQILPQYYDHIIWFNNYLNESLGFEN
jgi:predicted nucleotidyltransferase